MKELPENKLFDAHKEMLRQRRIEKAIETRNKNKDREVAKNEKRKK